MAGKPNLEGLKREDKGGNVYCRQYEKHEKRQVTFGKHLKVTAEQLLHCTVQKSDCNDGGASLHSQNNKYSIQKE